MILGPCANIFAQKTFDVKVRWAVGGFKVASCTCQLTTLLPQKKETFWAHLDTTMYYLDVGKILSKYKFMCLQTMLSCIQACMFYNYNFFDIGGHIIFPSSKTNIGINCQTN